MNGEAAYADWIAVDWGTSRLRAWAISGAGDIRAQTSSEQGMGRLEPAEFEAALVDLIDDWLGEQPVPVLACGMVGARQGWREVPYVKTPAKPNALRPVRVADVRDPRLAVWIVPGLSQSTPPDIMRGEETQIAGILAFEPQFDGVICLPGTHTKWVRVSAEEIVSFQTAMTGEMFELLSENSILRHVLVSDGLDRVAFENAVSDALSRPERLAQSLFAIRADATLNAVGADVSRARLSGTLIGAEIAAARAYWLGHDVIVAGAPELADLYATALRGQGAAARTLDGAKLTLAGLARIRAQMNKVV